MFEVIQDGLCLLHILFHLEHKGISIREFLLSPKSFYEGQINMLIINIVMKIKEKNLDGHGTSTEGGPHAYGCHAVKPVTVNMGLHGVNPVLGQQLVCRMQVGRGKSERLAPMGSRNDLSLDRIMPSEKAGSFIYPTAG